MAPPGVADALHSHYQNRLPSTEFKSSIQT